MISLFNTLTGQTEDLKPLDGRTFKVYACGPTVYDYQHIGNYTTALRYDLLVRTLTVLSGYDVDYVMNLTDVGHLTSDADEGEDKLVNKAQQTGKTAWDVAEYFIEDYKKWLEAFNFTDSVRLLRATDYIDQQISLVKRLEEKGYTYEIDDGVYFDTSKFDNYACLAKLDIDGLEEGARVGKNHQKKNPTDFAVWKFCPQDKNRDMQWDSPWGIGFPGWHLECSAMAMTELGEQLDLHGGGSDLISVHHTNEIAQSEAATNKTFVKHWFHSAFVNINNDKLSKSRGNGVFPSEFAEQGIDPLAFRMFVIRSKYRTQSNFTWDLLHEAQVQLQELRNFATLRFQLSDTVPKIDFESAKSDVSTSMANDLNSPNALSQLLALVANAHNGVSNSQGKEFNELLQWIDDLFGLNLLSTNDLNQEQKDLINRRVEVKASGDFELADSIRDELLNQKIVLRDIGSESIWQRA